MRDLLVGQIVDNVEADRLVDLGERGEVKILAEQFDQRQTLLGQQGFQKVAELGLVQPADFLLERDRVAVGDGGADMGEERGTDDAVLAVDVGVGFGRTGARRRFVLVFQRRLPWDRPGGRVDDAGQV